MRDIIIFDFSGTLVKMRPAKLLLQRKLLLKLNNKYKLAIVTGAKGKETINILNKLKIKDNFSIIVTKDDSNFRKPNQKLFLLIKNKIVFNKAWYVGDKLKDYEFATNSGIEFLFVGKKKVGVKQDKNINKLLEYLI